MDCPVTDSDIEFYQENGFIQYQRFFSEQQMDRLRDVIDRAIDGLHAYIDRKTRQLRRAESRLRGITVFNHRQRDLIGHALRHPHHQYTIHSHRVSHDIAYQTANRDLLDLRDRGLLKAFKIGKTYHFTPTENLEELLSEIGAD